MPFLRPLEYFENRFHDKQEEAWLAYKAGLDLVLPWGRRSGKDDFFSEIAIEDIEDNGYPCLYTAITQKQARSIIWPKVTERLKHQPGWKPNETRMEFIYKGGPYIAVKGADLRPDDLAGGAYRLIGCSEFALWKKPEIKQKILAPMLVDYNGQFCVHSTKRGKNHFYKLHREALKNPDKYFVSEATIFDNPYISEEGKRKIVFEYEGGDHNPLYQQEILNKYVVFEGQVFALDEASYTEPMWDRATLDWSVHWRGMDHGYSPDPTALVWMAWNDRKGHYQIYFEYREPSLLIKTHADAIKEATNWAIFDTYSDIDPQVIAEYEAVGLHMSPANKADKNARLLSLVNALRTGRLKIATNCKRLLEEMAAYEWNQDGNDHCFVAGTMVETEFGPLPIETIQPGTRVWTRAGLKRVLIAGCTGTKPILELTFSNGSVLNTTANHPIFTYENDYVRADSLLPDAHSFAVFPLWQSRNASSLTASSSDDIQSLSRDHHGSITGRIRDTSCEGLDTCIRKSGSIISGQSPKAIISTIKTAIRSITTFPTWNAFRRRNISQNIENRDQPSLDRQNKRFISNRSEILQKNGIVLPKADNGILSTASRLLIRLSRCRRYLRSASFAALDLKHSIIGETSQKFARTGVHRSTVEIQDLITKSVHASHAEKNSRSTDSQSNKTAPANVAWLLQRRSKPAAAVYNLTVEDCHEYFANGILVHNCIDALSYVWSSHAIPEKQPEPEPEDRWRRRDDERFERQDFGDS